ncbi:MAG: metallophosphoesterase family protein [Verrucomicrobiota bacterium]
MRIAIFGDIHANLEALQTVLEDARGLGCSTFVCIGDIVGYNANPKQCLDLVRELDCPTVKGNHDEFCSRKDVDLDRLNPLAKATMSWTRDQLDDDDKQWLDELKLVRQVRDFTIVHATLDSPGAWAYVSNKFDAMASFNYQYTPVCFFGHTHVPRVYEKALSVETRQEYTATIEAGRKYFINVGSVGQPRDGDWRSAYAVYDLNDKRVTIRRLEYDIATTQKKIRAAGLPDSLADRLALGK